jgi:cell division protein ZapA (FtsZ GTPase activity inhibitor)
MSTQETPIVVLGHSIPVVASADELQRLRAAAALIDDKVSSYRSQYDLQDDGYLLRMACLELATSLLAAQASATTREAELTAAVTTLDAALAADLKRLGLPG